MSNYKLMAIRQRKWMLLILIASAAGTLTPYSKLFLGLLLGIIIRFYNLWLLQRKTNLLGEAAEREGKRIGIGTISRLASAALGVLIAIKYDLDIIGFIIGLMTSRSEERRVGKECRARSGRAPRTSNAARHLRM